MIANLEKLIKHHGFKRYFKNTSWLLTEKVLRIIAGLFVGIWVARFLGPEEFGIYSYSIAFVTLFGAIGKLGLQNIVIRDLVQKESNKEVILGTTFYMKIVGALLMILLIVLVLPLTSNDTLTKVYIIIIASGIIFQSFEVIDFHFQAEVLSKYVSISRVFQLIVSSLLKIVFIIVQADLIYFVVVFLVDHIMLATALSFVFWQKSSVKFYRHFSFKKAKSLIRDSWPLIISGIVITIYMRIDQIMIKEMMDSEAVGLYSAAVKLSEAWFFIPMIITQSLYPAIINAKINNKNLYKIRLQRLFNLMFFISLGVAILITFTSDLLINLLYGDSYTGAGIVLSIHVWAGLFVSSGVVSSKWFIIENLQKYSMYRTSAGALINVILNLILIPIYGIIGSAVATLISQFVASILLNAIFSNTKDVFNIQMKAILGLGLKGNKQLK